jgi:hypothetical protein
MGHPLRISLASTFGIMITALLLVVTPARSGESQAAITVGLRVVGAPPGSDAARAPSRGARPARRARAAGAASGPGTIRITFGGLSSSAWAESQIARRPGTTLR